MIKLLTLSIWYFLVVFCTTCTASSLDFQVFISSDGIYSLSYDDLKTDSDNALPECISSKNMSLRQNNEEVRYWIDGKNDRGFCSGDRILFRGYVNQCLLTGNKLSALQLSISNNSVNNQNNSKSITPTFIEKNNAEDIDLFNVPMHQVCLQQNNIRMPLSAIDYQIDNTVWYWGKFYTGIKAPLHINVITENIHPEQHQVNLNITLRSTSQSNHKRDYDHLVEVRLNKTSIGQAQWNGTGVYHYSTTFNSQLLSEGENQFSLFATEQMDTNNQNPIIDVIYLDTIQVKYSRGLSTSTGQLSLKLPETNEFHLNALPNQFIELFTAHDWVRLPKSSSLKTFQITFDGVTDEVMWVNDQQYMSPDKIRQKRDQAQFADTTDYLIITHSDLSTYIEPLKKFHEKSGKQVTLLDTESIYDQWNFGLASADAIHQAIKNVYNNSSGALTNILLVGDANWQVESNSMNSPDSQEKPIWVPTWQSYNRFGVGASDAKYADVDDDGLPDIALGRLAANSAEELNVMIKKTIEHQEDKSFGLWKSKFSMLSDQTRLSLAKEQRIISGLSINQQLQAQQMIEKTEDGAAQDNVINAFNEGKSLVHFYGHGGRFMWDLGNKSNKQFFDMNHVSQLANTQLPVVLMMTCAAGPYDHPNTNSMAELFMSLPEAGAVAVISSSTRNIPKKPFSRFLIKALMDSSTVGDALLMAKRKVNDPLLTDVYNLLGDPAVKLNLPDHEIKLSMNKELNLMQVKIPFESLSTEVIVEEFNKDMLKIKSQNLTTSQPEVNTKLNKDTKYALVYVYDDEAMADGIGFLTL